MEGPTQRFKNDGSVSSAQVTFIQSLITFTVRSSQTARVFTGYPLTVFVGYQLSGTRRLHAEALHLEVQTATG
jgi:hypothetical protein